MMEKTFSTHGEEMRTFFLMAHDGRRKDLETVSDYDMGQFDLMALWSGRPVMDPLPESVRLFLADGLPSDYLGNPLTWKIVSAKYLSFIERHVRRDYMQVIPAPLFGVRDRKPRLGYSIVNPTVVIDALAEPFSEVTDLAFKTALISNDVNMFRIAGHETLVCVSSEFMDDLVKGEKLKGLSFIRTRSVS